MFDVPEILQPVLGNSPRVAAILYGSIGAVVLLFVLVIWLVIGRGPRRWRRLRRARHLLREGKWADAQTALSYTRRIGSPSARWRRRFDQLEAETHQLAAKEALAEKEFETALDHSLTAARLLDQPELDMRINLQNLMLHEIRRLFATMGQTRECMDLIARTLGVQAPCREASFWLAMCNIRNSQPDHALSNLQTARTGQDRPLEADDESATKPAAPPSPFIDPPLYLGALLLRQGKAREALRYLTEANRMDPGCPVVALELGAAMIEAGSDTQFAVRTLQRALGPRGLGQWAADPGKAWVEAFPDHRSYVRKLAGEFPYPCPLWGPDLLLLVRQGNFALAQGQFRLGNYQDAADLFDKVLKEGGLSYLVLRGLGLSLAKLGKYDEAFKHLRTAHEMEIEKDRLTTGYLALCGALGKPTVAEDKPINVGWAVKTVQQFNAPSDPEWAGLLNALYAEARQVGVELTADDQLYLCEHLLTVGATDPTAAAAFHHLMATHPALMHREYAWLYCRADQQHRVGGERVLDLYALTFADPAAARTFFGERGWDFDAVELAYLERAAEHAPGRFPDVLGPDYAARGEALLLARSEAQEQAGQFDDALDTIETLVRLSPANTRAIDRAAALHHRAGRPERAVELLENWHRTRPDDPLPLVRQAVLLHQQGHETACRDKVRQAAALSTGRRRAKIAFLGARMLLQSYLIPGAVEGEASLDQLPAVQEFLEDCLAHDPAHPDAPWALAAVRWLRGDSAGLAEQAATMDRPDALDPRFHYLAALCHLAGGDFPAALRATGRIPAGDWHPGRNGDAGKLDLGVEAGYLAALAHLGAGDLPAAAAALRPVASASGSPTRFLADARLGAVLFQEGRHDDAVRCWHALDPKQRHVWALAEPLALTTFVSAVEVLHQGKYEQAAEKFRQAGRLGCRDRRLGPLLLLALFKAGQAAVYGSTLQSEHVMG